MGKVGGFRRAFILPDQHYARPGCPEGGVDKKAERVALQAVRVIKPDMFFNLGDAGEWGSVSPYEWKKTKRPSVKDTKKLLRKDVKAINEGLDKWDEVCKDVGVKEKVFTEGNHELWARNFAEEEDEEHYLPEVAMRLEERGYDFYPFGQYYKLGKLRIYHGGHYGGENHTKTHLIKTGCNVLYGHHHGKQSFGLPTLEGDRAAWSIGCIAKLHKRFLKGRATDWRHGFATVDVWPNGDFQLTDYCIVNGKCAVWGQELRG